MVRRRRTSLAGNNYNTSGPLPEGRAGSFMNQLVSNRSVKCHVFEEIIRTPPATEDARRDMFLAIMNGLTFFDTNPCFDREEYVELRNWYRQFLEVGSHQIRIRPELQLRKLFSRMCVDVVQVIQEVSENGTPEERHEITDGLMRPATNGR